MISTKKHQQLVEKMDRCFVKAANVLDEAFIVPKLTFNIRGFNLAGRAHFGKNELQLNPLFVQHYWRDTLHDTVPHEVAHFIVKQLERQGHYAGKVKPHGKEWKNICELLGASSKKSGQRCYAKIQELKLVHKLRKTKFKRVFQYTCGKDGCGRKHFLSAIRHNRSSKKVQCMSVK